jgi:competence protein ComFC
VSNILLATAAMTDWRCSVNGVELPDGPWEEGWALAWHTEYGMQRTPIAEQLYQLKYRSDTSQIGPLADALAAFLGTRRGWPKLAAIVPVPPSNEKRPLQPVRELARALAERTGLPLAERYLLKRRQTRMLKHIDSLAEREQEVAGVFTVTDPERYRGQWVLLFDDICQSGTTLAAATRVLREEGGVAGVYVLVVTLTRTYPEGAGGAWRTRSRSPDRDDVEGDPWSDWIPF